MVEFIERNLDSKMTLQLLSEQAGISPFHLHRLFLVYTGEPIAGFIRRTRLAAGYSRLQDADTASVLDTALSVGYDSVSGFVRAFRKRFGFTPGTSARLRVNSRSLWQTQRTEAANFVATPQRIEAKASHAIVGIMESGYEGRSFQKAAERAFKLALSLIERHDLWSQVGRACAVMFEDPDLEIRDRVRYFGGFELTKTEHPSYYGLDVIIIESGSCAVFTHSGSYKNLWQTWNIAYRNWLPNSAFRLRDAFPFEVYLNDPRTVRSERDLVTEIYLPIERR